MKDLIGLWDLVLPVPGDTVKCGLRTDLPKKQRRHTWVDLGTDVRNLGEKGFREVQIHACIICGADKKGKSDGA